MRRIVDEAASGHGWPNRTGSSSNANANASVNAVNSANSLSNVVNLQANLFNVNAGYTGVSNVAPGGTQPNALVSASALTSLTTSTHTAGRSSNSILAASLSSSSLTSSSAAANTNTNSGINTRVSQPHSQSQSQPTNAHTTTTSNNAATGTGVGNAGHHRGSMRANMMLNRAQQQQIQQQTQQAPVPNQSQSQSQSQSQGQGHQLQRKLTVESGQSDQSTSTATSGLNHSVASNRGDGIKANNSYNSSSNHINNNHRQLSSNSLNSSNGHQLRRVPSTGAPIIITSQRLAFSSAVLATTSNDASAAHLGIQNEPMSAPVVLGTPVKAIRQPSLDTPRTIDDTQSHSVRFATNATQKIEPADNVAATATTSEMDWEPSAPATTATNLVALATNEAANNDNRNHDNSTIIDNVSSTGSALPLLNSTASSSSSSSSFSSFTQPLVRVNNSNVGNIINRSNGAHFQPSHPSQPSQSSSESVLRSQWRPAGSGYNPCCGASNADSESPLTSMCFTLRDGNNKVSSLAFTKDGAYCVAGFASGAVRLFDLTLGGNTDPEDRYGYYLGGIKATSAQSGSLHLQLHLSETYAIIPENSDNNVNSNSSSNSSNRQLVSHLFVGSKLGSNTMLAIDLAALRDLKRKRGFITTVGGGVKTFTHSDSRLKGCVDLSVVSIEAHPNGMGYSARYRLLCGQGMQSYHVWDVVLEATSVSSVAASSNSNGNNTNSNINTNANNNNSTVHFESSWTVCATGSVNAPSLAYGKLVTCDPRIVAAQLKDASEVASNFHVPISSPSLPSCEVITRGADKDLRVLRLDQVMADKVVNIKNTAKVRAGSLDGSVLFSGSDELSVLRYVPRSGGVGSDGTPDSDEVLGRFRGQAVCVETFSLLSDMQNLAGINHANSTSNNNSNANNNVHVNARRERHLREISSIQCTSDGSYALVLCSDNAVLLYSPYDVFPGHGFHPTHKPSSSGGRNKGFLTVLFQASDLYRLELQISAISAVDANDDNSITINGNSNNSSDQLASQVVIGVAWWQPACPSAGGVLRTSRLDASLASLSQGTFTGLTGLPHAIAVPHVGLCGSTFDVPSDTSLGTHQCWLCGDRSIQHWDESVQIEANAMENDNEETDEEVETRRVSVSNRSNNNSHSSTLGMTDDSIPVVPTTIVTGKRAKVNNNNNNSNEDTAKAGSKIASSSNSNNNTKTSTVTSKKRSVDDHKEDSDNSDNSDHENETEVVSKQSRSSSTNRAHASSKSSTQAHLVSMSAAEYEALMDRVMTLEQSKEYYKTQAELTVRKADRRFQEEKRLRRDWNVRRAEYLEQITHLENENHKLRDDVNSLNHSGVRSAEVGSVLQEMQPSLARLLQLLGGSNNNSNIASDPSGTQQVPHGSSSSSSSIPSIRAPFCVICQDHTADCVVLNCGHLCLCREHAKTLNNTNRLQNCPLCKMPCAGVVPIAGMDRLV